MDNGNFRFFFLQSFIEAYDLNSDPFQLKNIASEMTPDLLLELNKKVLQLSVCSGS